MKPGPYSLASRGRASFQGALSGFAPEENGIEALRMLRASPRTPWLEGEFLGVRAFGLSVAFAGGGVSDE